MSDALLHATSRANGKWWLVRISTPVRSVDLPRPIFNLASGTSFITSTQELLQDDETSPVFPRRVEIIQSSGFEKPKLSSRKHPDRSNNWILAGVRGGSRDPYLSAGF